MRYGIIKAYDSDEWNINATHGIFEITEEYKSLLKARKACVEQIMGLSPRPDRIVFDDRRTVTFLKNDSWEKDYPEMFEFMEGIDEGCQFFDDIPDMLKKILEDDFEDDDCVVGKMTLYQRWYPDAIDAPIWYGYIGDSIIEIWTDDIPIKEIVENDILR